jgi:hypothetical protein
VLYLIACNDCFNEKGACGLSSYIVESLIYLVLEALFQVMVMRIFSVSLYAIAEFLVFFIIILKDWTVSGVSFCF